MREKMSDEFIVLGPDENVKLISLKPRPLGISFSTNTNEAVGKLYEKDGKLHFEGDVDKSARVFFEHLISVNGSEVYRLKEEIRVLEDKMEEAKDARVCN